MVPWNPGPPNQPSIFCAPWAKNTIPSANRMMARGILLDVARSLFIFRSRRDSPAASDWAGTGPAFDRNVFRGQILEPVTHRLDPANPVQDHARRSAVHIRHSGGWLWGDRLRQQSALSDRRDDDGDPAGFRFRQPAVPRRPWNWIFWCRNTFRPDAMFRASSSFATRSG